jgi:hypothetical protein
MQILPVCYFSFQFAQRDVISPKQKRFDIRIQRKGNEQWGNFSESFIEGRSFFQYSVAYAFLLS